MCNFASNFTRDDGELLVKLLVPEKQCYKIDHFSRAQFYNLKSKNCRKSGVSAKLGMHRRLLTNVDLTINMWPVV